MANGISDIGARVYILETGSYDFLFSCSDIGAIGGSVDKHESTCTDDTAKTYVIGRRDTPEVEFSYNYTEANAERSQSYFDGTTQRKLAVVYGDGSGYELSGYGTDSTDALGTNSLQKATFTFVQDSAPVHLGKTAMDARLTAPYSTTVATPTASPDGGAVASGAEVTLACATGDSTIYYTLDGSTPTKATGLLYNPSAKPTITSALTLKAIGAKIGMNNSAVLSVDFTLT